MARFTPKSGENETNSGRDFREIVDRVPAMIATANADGLHDYANKPALDFMGTTVEALQGLGFLSMIHPDDRERTGVAWSHSVRTGQPMDLAHRLRRFDGEYFWFHVRVEPTFDDAGKVVRWYGVLNNVDARKRAEDALRASERMLHQLVEAIPALVWRAKPDGQLDFVNQRVLEYTGARSDEMVESQWTTHLHPDDLVEAASSWRENVLLGRPHDASYRLRRFDGAYRWFQVLGEPLRNDLDEIVNWYGLLVDIDERKKAEKAQQETEVQASKMLESIPAIVWATDPSGAVTYLNRRVSDYFDAPPSELDQMKWAARIHPDDMEKAMQTRVRAIAAGQGYENVFRFRTAGKTYRWIHATVEPARDVNGTVEAWFGVFFDIDDRRRAEQELEEKERELRLITETIPAIVTARSDDGGLRYANQHFLAYTGKTFKELVESDSLLIHPDDRSAFDRIWQQAHAARSAFEMAYRLRRVDGTYRYFQVHGIPLLDGMGDVIRWYELKIDIDDRKRTEEALHIAQMKLTQTSRILTVAELSASIAHEINQPLAAVLVNGAECQSWLRATPPNIGSALSAVDRVIRDGRATEDVLDRIRALFKSVAPTRGRIDLNQVVGEVLALLNKELALKGVSTDLQLERDLPTTLADRTQIQQVLVNLMRNGIDAMDLVPLETKVLTLRTRQRQANLLLEICDVGNGIQEPGRLFEPFFTTKENGMGIGLSVCKSIINSHDGRIWATPNVPCGAVIHVSLPLQ